MLADIGFRCSNPGCRKPTSGPQDDPRGSVNIGVAHIAAASPGGTRYDPSMGGEVRASINNGIWLCQNCAKLVNNDALAYSVDILRAWRALAEATSKSEIERGITVQVDQRFWRAERDMPQLLTEMRADLKEASGSRQAFRVHEESLERLDRGTSVLLRRSSSIWTTRSESSRALD